MSAINFMGSYSGIDRSTIDQLMEAEKIPLIGLAEKKTDITTQQGAWKDVNMRLNSLFEKIKVLQNSDTYQSKTVNSTDEDTVTMTATNSSMPASYSINVQTLASSSRVIGEQVAVDTVDTDLNATGNMSITNHEGVALDIAVEATDSLSDIMTKINDGSEATGIKATIIDKRLVIEDVKSGARDITINGPALKDIGLKTPDTVTTGTNALFTVNGIQIERDSNTVSDVITGVSINIKNTHEVGQNDTVTIGTDTAKTEEAVKAFVDQYNSTMSFIEDKMAVGAPGSGEARGDLAGDSTLRRLHSSLRQMVTSQISNPENTSIREMSELGISTIDRYGVLKFDSAKFNEQMGLDLNNVRNFFSSETMAGDEIGFTHKVNNYIDSFISTSNGVIKGKSDSFTRSLKYVEKQIENFNRRIERKEQYYIKMFSALDVAMMQAESQMEWLSGQMSAMNAQAGARK